MLDSIGPSIAVPRVQMLPAKVGKPLPLAKKIIEVYRCRPVPPEPDWPHVELHNDIPPELLAIPQVVLGKSAAFASYTSTQAKRTPAGKPAESAEDPGVSGAVQELTPGTSLIRYGGSLDRAPLSPPATASPFAAAGSGEDWPVLSLEGEDEPVDVAASEPAPGTGTQPSGLRSFFREVADLASDAYYDFLKMVPYAAGILMNVLA